LVSLLLAKGTMSSMIPLVVVTLLGMVSAQLIQPENVTSTVECPNGDLTKCTPLNQCPTTVLEEHGVNAWNADCEGLERVNVPAVPTAASCKASCHAQFNCSVWQFSNYLNGVKSTKTPLETFCYTGVPTKNCRSRASFVPIAGERVQRGAVLVTKSAKGIEVLGLHSYKMDTGTEAEKIKRCKDECYSNVDCGVWYYYNKVGSRSDCYYERYGRERTGEVTTSDHAKLVQAGEFITHYCPTPVPKKMGPLPWKWIIPSLILGLLACLGVLMCCEPQPKEKATRAVKIAPKSEPPEDETVFTPVYTVQPQYTMAVQKTQPIVTQQVEQRVTREERIIPQAERVQLIPQAERVVERVGLIPQAERVVPQAVPAQFSQIQQMQPLLR